MNLENVVLVRAMNNIPLDGLLIPSCEGKYLVKNNLSDFKDIIRKIVKKEIENNLGRELDLWDDADEKYFENIVSEFYPYSSYYTSTLSFSFNGLAPDDINNTFSLMKVAVLDPIKNHEELDYVNIDAIDTTVKGRVKVSNEAILLIDKDLYYSLSQEHQENLMANYNVELFIGEIREAVSDVLIKYNYPSLPLIQSRERNDILDCKEKESMIEFQDVFAKQHNASRLKLQFLYQWPINTMVGVDAIAAEKVQSDYQKILTVQKYYDDQLYMFLLAQTELLGIAISDLDKETLMSEYGNSKIVLENITNELIKAHGLEGLKKLIQEFNQSVLDNYLTNEEIIALNDNGRKQ